MKKRVDTAELDAVIERGIGWLGRTQEASGSWPGDYGGPMFLLPLYVATAHIIGLRLEPEVRAGMLRYIRSKQNDDGGFGLHVEGPSTIYGSVTNYVALRLLGTPQDDQDAARARAFIQRSGGPTGSASWGKFFLALLGLYPYEGLRPVPPELWLVPESLPFHPSKLWCHCRMVYLPMSYLYGARKKAADSSLLEELRNELYDGRWHEIDFESARLEVAEIDELSPESSLSVAATKVLTAFESRFERTSRKRALSFVLHQIEREDQNTNYICIGPINKLLNTLVWFFEDPKGPELERHIERLPDYLYRADDGIKMQGYNSSRLWDTAFAAQALWHTGSPHAAALIERAYAYIDQNQVREDVRDPSSAYRHRSKGGWPFSDQPHGWPISDCTAEGLKACILTEHTSKNPVSAERLRDAAELILSLQNTDGGWATYELMRGPAWLELLNPSNCFRDIMVDYSYVECTSACVQALAAFAGRYPEVLCAEVARAIERGSRFLLDAQRPDGSFEGSWGVCFTYGTWFGVTGLRSAGLAANHKSIRKARAFLESKQNVDGGWGESVDNCVTRSYAPGVPSQVVMTSWALLALIAAGAAESTPAEEAVQFLTARQGPDGSYPNENVAGVFNKTCAIHYDNYLKIFPVWALSEYRSAR